MEKLLRVDRGSFVFLYKSSIFVNKYLLKGSRYMTFVKGLFLCSALTVLLACAGSNSSVESDVEKKPVQKASLSKFACPASSDLRGEGFGASSDEALQMAQRQIANRIQSTVESSSNMKRVQTEDANGAEKVSSSYEVNSQVYSRLENAQAARQIGMIDTDGGVGVVACMSVEDAMKPYRDQYIGNGVHMVLKASTFDVSKHPLEKLAAYDSAKVSYAGLTAARNVMDIFHYSYQNENGVNVDSIYNALTENYRQFKSQYAFYYDPTNGGEREVAVFARISQQYRVVAGQCQGGVLLSVEANDGGCKDGSFGTSCTSMLTLTGSSCFGDVYFAQKTMVKGTGKYGKEEAEERLMQNISSGEWFTLWTKVLDQWNLK